MTLYRQINWLNALQLQEDDPVVQRKALFELKRVYREATLLRNLKNKERRRRQTKITKKQKS